MQSLAYPESECPARAKPLVRSAQPSRVSTSPIPLNHHLPTAPHRRYPPTASACCMLLIPPLQSNALLVVKVPQAPSSEVQMSPKTIIRQNPNQAENRTQTKTALRVPLGPAQATTGRLRPGQPVFVHHDGRLSQENIHWTIDCGRGAMTNIHLNGK